MATNRITSATLTDAKRVTSARLRHIYQQMFEQLANESSAAEQVVAEARSPTPTGPVITRELYEDALRKVSETQKEIAQLRAEFAESQRALNALPVEEVMDVAQQANASFDLEEDEAKEAPPAAPPVSKSKRGYKRKRAFQESLLSGGFYDSESGPLPSRQTS